MYLKIGNIHNLPTIRELISSNESYAMPSKLKSPTEVAFSIESQRLAYDHLVRLGVNIPATEPTFVCAEGFNRIKTSFSFQDRLADIVHIRKPSLNLQVLDPGCFTMIHLDVMEGTYITSALVDPVGQWDRFNLQERIAFRDDPGSVVRYFVMMEDWQPGHGIIFQDCVLSSWVAGDVFYWDWQTVIHSTFNTGSTPRSLIRLTGLRTNESRALIRDAVQGHTFKAEY